MRTRTEIVKDFEALGYEIDVDDRFELRFKGEGGWIRFNKELRSYEKEGIYGYSLRITTQEHILINELLQAMGWINAINN